MQECHFEPLFDLVMLLQPLKNTHHRFCMRRSNRRLYFAGIVSTAFTVHKQISDRPDQRILRYLVPICSYLGSKRKHVPQQVSIDSVDLSAEASYSHAKQELRNIVFMSEHPAIVIFTGHKQARAICFRELGIAAKAFLPGSGLHTVPCRIL